MRSSSSHCRRQRNSSSWLSLVLFSLACVCFSRTNHVAHAFLPQGGGGAFRIAQQSSSVSSIRVPLQLFNVPSKANGVTTAADEPIPFVIERLGDQPTDFVFLEIATMCIQAFFNDGEPGRKISFWKEWQLSYLRTLQQADLRRRRKRDTNTNMMFVARRVVPASGNMVQTTPLILDLATVVNLKDASPTNDYVRAEVLGFVEVTQRPYGLGDKLVGFDDASKIQLRKSDFYEKRPILTNLSVAYDARKSGLGSRLMETCEQEVARDWDMKEIILEVEDENMNALQFYLNRGYTILFADPTNRRYDTTGLTLQQVRCSRQVMRKPLGFGQIQDAAGEVQSTLNQFGVRVLQLFSTKAA
jgi:ribosomal protein S18 acetylase RimI-like enzyme